MSWLERELGEAYEIKTERLGLDDKLLREGKVLNRILRVTELGWEVEADPRHAELVIEQLGPSQEKPAITQGISGSKEDDLPEDEPLRGADITSYRGVTARCNYLGPDMPDAQIAIKECCREMSAPPRVLMTLEEDWQVPRDISDVGAEARRAGGGRPHGRQLGPRREEFTALRRCPRRKQC